jgi:hypothetical protein
MSAFSPTAENLVKPIEHFPECLGVKKSFSIPPDVKSFVV